MNTHSPGVFSVLGPSSQGGKGGEHDDSSEVREQTAELGMVAGALSLAT